MLGKPPLEEVKTVLIASGDGDVSAERADSAIYGWIAQQPGPVVARTRMFDRSRPSLSGGAALGLSQRVERGGPRHELFRAHQVRSGLLKLLERPAAQRDPVRVEQHSVELAFIELGHADHHGLEAVEISERHCGPPAVASPRCDAHCRACAR